MVKTLKSSLYFQYISKRNIVTLSNLFIIYVGLLVIGLPIKIFNLYTLYTKESAPKTTYNNIGPSIVHVEKGYVSIINMAQRIFLRIPCAIFI